MALLIIALYICIPLMFLGLVLFAIGLGMENFKSLEDMRMRQKRNDKLWIDLQKEINYNKELTKDE